LAALLSPVSPGQAHDLPTASRLARDTPQWPALNSAPPLQSRGGDGFSGECNRRAVARLPEREVCGEWKGSDSLQLGRSRTPAMEFVFAAALALEEPRG